MPSQTNRSPRTPSEAATGATERSLNPELAKNPVWLYEIPAESYVAKVDAERKKVSEIFQEVVRKRQKRDRLDAAIKENDLVVGRVQGRMELWVSDMLPLIHMLLFITFVDGIRVKGG